MDDDDKDDDDNVCVVHERLRADAFCAETITNFPTNRVSPASSDNNCIPLCIAQLLFAIFAIWSLLTNPVSRKLDTKVPSIP